MTPARRRPGLPFAGINLRRNPFGGLDRAETARVAVVDVDAAARRLRERLTDVSAPALAVQYVGPPGSGKSTHLLALRARFPGAGYAAWSATDGWPALPGGEPLLVDDAHLLPRRLARAAHRRRLLVLCTQRDLSAALEEAGFEVRTVRVGRAVDARLLGRIVRRRLEWARRGPGPLPVPADAELAELVRRHRPDLRAVMAALYRRIQRLDDIARRARDDGELASRGAGAASGGGR